MAVMYLWILLAFGVGLVFGSFLNVCIARLPHHASIVRPRSHCPACQHPIRWFDNIPLLSWILLRARCRDCGAPISWQYPAVEFVTGLWFAAIATRIDASAYDLIDAFAIAALGFLLIGLIVMDWQTLRLPDAFTLWGLAIAVFLVCTQAIFLGPTEAQINLTNHRIRLSSPGSFAERGNVFLTGPEHLIFGRLLAIAAIATLLLVIRSVYRAVRKRDGLGLGDVKMLAMIAAFLGFAPAILTLFVAILLATLYALPMVLRGRATAITKLPFGSFLGIAGLAVALIGEPVLTWYTGLFH